jgi:hypothetical protein
MKREGGAMGIGEMAAVVLQFKTLRGEKYEYGVT